MANEIGR